MAKQIKFTSEDEERIIEFVKSNELIYNVQHKNYRDSEMKNRLWTEFAQKIGKDGNLRSNYHCIQLKNQLALFSH